ncbi:MAG: hypothetical protein HON70_45605, partial [Lentisphaerae bacterium]|nr:hypothetical protein [Lentisphaerota bacterium]
EITADLLTDIQTELANAVFDVRVRRFDANQVVDLTDTDLDGLPDAWETEVFGGLEQDPWMDYDNDYLTNYEEWEMGLDATDPDTDDDGYYDKAETMIPGADPDDPNVPGGGVVITGTIYDSSTGNPAASAHVSALMWGNSAPPLVSASTDDDANQDPGTYEIEIPAGVEVILVAGGPFLLPGFYDASVTPEGATPIRSFSPGDLPGIDITLGPARPVLGTLLDTADGVPLPNIPVDAFATADAAFLSRTRSRADGSYTLWVPLDTEFVIEAGGNSYVKEYHDDVALFGDALAYTLTGTDVLTSIDFSLEFNSDIAARVLGFEIEQIWVHGRPQRDLHYLLNIEVDTDESVAEVAFDTPAGNTFVIPDEVFTEEGAVSTSRWYDMGRGVYVWKHEGAFADPTELTPYGDGDYVVRVTFRDGRVQETTFPFSAPDVRAAIPQPMEAPVFLSPTQDELVTDPVTITWDAYTEDVAEALFMDLDDGDIETLAIDDTSYVAGVLGPGRHTAVLCFENGREAENADGIPYEVLKSSESTLDFVVADGADLQLELFPDGT